MDNPQNTVEFARRRDRRARRGGMRFRAHCERPSSDTMNLEELKATLRAFRRRAGLGSLAMDALVPHGSVPKDMLCQVPMLGCAGQPCLLNANS
jgi:hypothetical protein